jgi:hypothetical protein
MTMKMRSTPLGSAVPRLAGQDPNVEIDTDFEIALRHLKQAANRLKSAALQHGTASDQEIPIRHIKR